MKTKKCFKCGKRKSVKNFHVNRHKKDGYNHTCSKCNTQRVSEWLAKNKSWYYDYSRDKKNANHRIYTRSEKGKKMQLLKVRRMKLKFPEKWSARSKLRYEVKMGRIKKLSCQVCGDIKSEAHHKDYSKPLEVMWLCKKHHREQHNNYNFHPLASD